MNLTRPCLLAALLLTANVALAQSAYKAGEYHYTRTQALTLTLDMSGQQSTTTTTTDEQLTLSLAAKGRDTLTFALTFDSVKSSGDGARLGRGGGGGRGGRSGGGLLGMLGGGGGALEGQSLRGAMAPNGRFHDEGTAPIAARAMRQFLIVLPPTMTAGARWTDTMPPIMLPFGGPNIEGNRIAETQIVRDTTYRGQRAWKLRRTVTLQMQASVAMGGAGGAGNELYAEGTGEGTFYISAAGVFLGGTDALDIAVTITLSTLQLPVAIRQESTVTFVR